MQTATPYPHILHGCDYNPEQWLDRPDILSQDILQMQQAGINCVSLGIFAWAALEPAEGDYRLEERTHDGLFRCPECSRPLDFDDEDDPES